MSPLISLDLHEKAKLDSDPLSGAEVERLVEGFFKLDPTVLGKLKEALR